MTQKRLTIDFETYYSQEFSLSKMAMQSYVLADDFEVIGVSVAINHGDPAWFSGTMEDTRKWLQKFHFEDTNTLTVAQNAHFEGAILEWVFGIRPSRYYCTQMGARPFDVPFTERNSAGLAKLAKYYKLPPKGEDLVASKGLRRADFSREHLVSFSDYCDHDVELTRTIAYAQLPRFPDDELDLIDLTVKKFTRPEIKLNTALLMLGLESHVGDKERLLAAAGVTDRGEVMSNNKFAALLEALSVSPPMKMSPTTGQPAYAFAKTDQGFQALLSHPNEMVRGLAEARLANKSSLMETRLRSFIALSETRELLGIPLTYYGATTGRYSGSGGVNLQNMPRGSILRQAMEAPEGKVIVASDLSQVEARVMATWAGEVNLEEQFRAGEDVYSNFSTVLYGYPVSKATPDERMVGKVSVLQLQYGSGSETLCTALRNGTPSVELDVVQSERTVQVYRAQHPHIKALWNQAKSWLNHLASGDVNPVEYKGVKFYGTYMKRGPAVVLPNGMPIFYPELKRDMAGEFHYRHRNAWAKMYGAKLVQNIVQALARIIITDAELYMARAGYPPCLGVHDELVFVIDETKADKLVNVLEHVMVMPPPFMPTVPLDCEVSYGKSYAECK